jgi:hypothetical protein
MTYRADDPNLLTGMLHGEGVHLDPASILDGLTADQARTKPHGLPHSVSEIVAHMCFWQEWFNDCAVHGFSGIAEHAVDGWPPVSDDAWDALRTRYLQAIEAAKRIARRVDLARQPVVAARRQDRQPFESIARICHPADGRAQQPSPRSDHHNSSVDEPVAPPGGTLTW